MQIINNLHSISYNLLLASFGCFATGLQFPKTATLDGL
jgi:hypothetical protein